MHATKLHVTVTEDRRVSLPNTVPTGPAEIIVLSENTPPGAEIEARGAFGCARGLIHMAHDFDAPLPDMDEYSR
jgi:hypothetical protein